MTSAPYYNFHTVAASRNGFVGVEFQALDGRPLSVALDECIAAKKAPPAPQGTKGQEVR